MPIKCITMFLPHNEPGKFSTLHVHEQLGVVKIHVGGVAKRVNCMRVQDLQSNAAFSLEAVQFQTVEFLVACAGLYNRATDFQIRINSKICLLRHRLELVVVDRCRRCLDPPSSIGRSPRLHLLIT